MAVAHDAFSVTAESTAGTYSWTHTPVGTPRGVLVFTMNRGGHDAGTYTVTYGGVAMTLVEDAFSSGGDLGWTKAWFLGSGIPTGAQTVEVTRPGTDSQRGCAITVTADGVDTEVYTPGIVVLEGTDSSGIAEQLVDDGTPRTNSMRYAGAYWDGTGDEEPNTGANSTLLHSDTDGIASRRVVRETTAGRGPRLVGVSRGPGGSGSGGRAFIHLAIREDLATETRTSQDATETVVLPTSGKTRTSQDATETVVLPTSGKARTSQEPVETALRPTGGKTRVSQEPVEVAYLGARRARVSQVPVEVLQLNTPRARLSQAELEAAVAPTSGVSRISQAEIEAALSPTSGQARLSQAEIEAAVASTSGNVHLTQAEIEVAIQNIVGYPRSFGTIVGL